MVSLCLNKNKIVSKNSSTLGMKKAAMAILNFKAHSFQTAQALLTGSSRGLLDLWNYDLDIHVYILLFLQQSSEGKGKIVFNTNIRNLISKQENWSTKMYFRYKKLATDNNVINSMHKFLAWHKNIDDLVFKVHNLRYKFFVDTKKLVNLVFCQIRTSILSVKCI